MVSAISSSHLKAQLHSLHIGPHGARPSVRIKAFYGPAERRETLYQVLGVAENGTVAEIKKAYKEMAKKYHPDVSAPERMGEHAKRFIMVHEAYQTLSDPRSRALYDRNLARGDGKRGMEEKGWWRIRWQTQLDELQRRNAYKAFRKNVTWAS